MKLPTPSGWFAVAPSAELGPADVRTVGLGDAERVLFRDGRGVVAVVDPYCPHLGAHLGRGGRVVEGSLACPFHGLSFDGEGACVHVPSGSRAPRRARLQTHPVVESGGWLFTWLDPAGGPPTWQPPTLASSGWGRLRTHELALRTHPQETTENSVDLAHFPVVHRYRDVKLHELSTDGPHLCARYGFVRTEGVALLRGVRVEIVVHVWGLGFSYVEAELPDLGLQFRFFVLPTPVGEGIVLRLGTQVRPGSTPLRSLPAWLYDLLLGPLTHRDYVRDVLADRDIWEHKVHLERPALLAEEGPIGQYRAWARQFYPPGAQVGVAQSGAGTKTPSSQMERPTT